MICRSYYCSLLRHTLPFQTLNLYSSTTLPFQTLKSYSHSLSLSPPNSLSKTHNGHGASLTQFIDPELPWRLAKCESWFLETSITFYPFRTHSTLITVSPLPIPFFRSNFCVPFCCFLVVFLIFWRKNCVFDFGFFVFRWIGIRG